LIEVNHCRNVPPKTPALGWLLMQCTFRQGGTINGLQVGVNCMKAPCLLVNFYEFQAFMVFILTFCEEKQEVWDRPFSGLW
jgi:hypothetical protein